MRTDLKDARVKAGLTQAELAACIGRDQAAISRYENGNADVDKDVAQGIATALGMNVLDVLYPPTPAPIPTPDQKAEVRDAA